MSGDQENGTDGDPGDEVVVTWEEEEAEFDDDGLDIDWDDDIDWAGQESTESTDVDSVDPAESVRTDSAGLDDNIWADPEERPDPSDEAAWTEPEWESDTASPDESGGREEPASEEGIGDVDPEETAFMWVGTDFEVVTDFDGAGIDWAGTDGTELSDGSSVAGVEVGGDGSADVAGADADVGGKQGGTGTMDRDAGAASPSPERSVASDEDASSAESVDSDAAGSAGDAEQTDVDDEAVGSEAGAIEDTELSTSTSKGDADEGLSDAAVDAAADVDDAVSSIDSSLGVDGDSDPDGDAASLGHIPDPKEDSLGDPEGPSEDADSPAIDPQPTPTSEPETEPQPTDGGGGKPGLATIIGDVGRRLDGRTVMLLASGLLVVGGVIVTLSASAGLGIIFQPGSVTVAADGSTEYSTIQEGVDEVEAGGTVRIEPGTYREQIRIRKPVRIEGAGAAGVTVALPANGTRDRSGFVVNARQGGGNVTISGLTVRNAEAGVRITDRSTTDVVVSDARLVNNTVGLDAPHTDTDWRVEGVTVRGSGELGLNATSATGNFTVVNSTIAGTERLHGIDAADTSGDWRVVGSEIAGNGRSRNETRGAGLVARNATGSWVFVGGAVRNNAGDAVVATNATGDWRVSDSFLQGNGGAGVAATGTESEWTVSGTRIVAHDGPGIDASGTAGAWTVNRTRVADADGVAVNATATSGSWTLDGVTVVRTKGEQSRAIDARQSDAGWRAVDLSVTGSTTGVDAGESEGDWTLRNATIQRVGGTAIDAAETSGQWRIGRTRITGSGSGINATRTTGGWQIRRTNLSSVGGETINAFRSGGNWRIVSVTIRDSDFGVRADATTGSWRIRSLTVERASVGVFTSETTGRWDVVNSEFVATGTGVEVVDPGGVWRITRNRFVDLEYGVSADRVAGSQQFVLENEFENVSQPCSAPLSCT